MGKLYAIFLIVFVLNCGRSESNYRVSATSHHLVNIFNPQGGNYNCLKCVISFIKSLESKTMYSPSSPGLYEIPDNIFSEKIFVGVTNGQSVTSEYIIENIHQNFSSHTKKPIYIMVLLHPRDSVIGHAIVGIANKGSVNLFDPQSGINMNFDIVGNFSSFRLHKVEAETLSDELLSSIGIYKGC